MSKEERKRLLDEKMAALKQKKEAEESGEAKSDEKATEWLLETNSSFETKLVWIQHTILPSLLSFIVCYVFLS